MPKVSHAPKRPVPPNITEGSHPRRRAPGLFFVNSRSVPERAEHLFDGFARALPFAGSCCRKNASRGPKSGPIELGYPGFWRTTVDSKQSAQSITERAFAFFYVARRVLRNSVLFA